MSEPKLQGKTQDIPKHLVWDAWLKVKRNGGAAGADGVTIEQFEERLKDRLYKLWNRMSSGSYFPGPVRAVEIPKKGGTRVLGIPNVVDRIAQTVAVLVLEPNVERVFHDDSYAYRPGRSPLDAVGTCRERCWRKDWIVDLDVKAFFDSVPWDLMLRALERHTDQKWVRLYVARWLKAPMLMPDGTMVARVKGTPQGGPMTPPTQLAIGPCFALRVGFGAGVGAVGGVASDRDGVSDRDLVGADEDVFDEQAQDSLAFFDGRSAGLGAQSGEEAFEVVGEFEVDLPVGELAVEGVDLLAQAGLSGPQLRHPGTEFVEGDQLFLEGADESGDRRGRLGQSGVETLALGGGGVRGADLLESLVDLGPDQGRVGEQAADVVPDDGVEVVGADRLVGADPAVLIAVVIRAEAAVVVDLLVGGAGRRAVVGVSAAAAGADALQQRGIAAVARGVALVVRQPLLGPGPGVSVDECRDRYLQPLLAGPLGHGVAAGRGAPGDPSCPVQPGRRLGAH